MTLLLEAESLILHQFSRSPRLKGLVRCLVKPLQETLDEIEKLHDGNYLKQAYGQTLDVIGSIVGQSRLEMSDEDYQPWIKVGIKLNTSAATPEHMLGILQTLYGGYPHIIMHEHAPNDVVFTLFTLPKVPLKTVVNIIRHAVPVSTVCHVIRADKGPAFRFDTSHFSELHFAEFVEEKL
jgi:hypothetical protein